MRPYEGNINTHNQSGLNLVEQALYGKFLNSRDRPPPLPQCI